MQLFELHEVAESVGIQYHEHILTEDGLIHAIQKANRHAPCFKSEQRFFCDEIDCEWKDACNQLIAEWKR